MVTEHIAREPQAPPDAAQLTLDGGAEPVGGTEPAKRTRGPKRSDEERIAAALAQAESIKAKAKGKTLDRLTAIKAELTEVAVSASKVGMPKLAAEIDKAIAALKKTDGLSD